MRIGVLGSNPGSSVAVCCFKVLLGAAACSDAAERSTDDRLPHELPFDSLFRLEREFVLADDAPVPMGMPVSMSVWNENLVLVDQMLAEVRVIEPGGRLRHIIGRPGDGPGEFRAPYAAKAHPDGDLVVFDPIARRVSIFNPAGAFSDSWSFPDFFFNSFAIADDGKLLFGGRRLDESTVSQDQWATIHVFTKSGEHLRSVGARPAIGTRPYERNMNQVWLTALGSLAFSVLIASNEAIVHDLDSGHEWRARAGESFYRPIEWLSAMPNQGDFQALRRWHDEQMLALWPVPIDSQFILSRFTARDESSGERIVYYDLLDRSGRSRATIRTTVENIIQFVDGDRAYAYRMDDASGEVRIRVFSVVRRNLS